MPDSSSSGRLRFDVTFPQRRAAESVDEDPVLRIAVIGNFSGDGPPPAGALPAPRVDIDSLDTVLAGWQAVVEVSGPASAAAGSPTSLTLRTLDEFHPDSLLARVPALSELMHLRARLQAPSTAAASLAEWRSRAVATPTPSSAPVPPAAESPGDTLSRLLGGSIAKPAAPAPRPPPAGPAGLVERLVRDATAGSATSVPSEEQRAALAQVETEIGQRLRSVLHAPRFQALEAAWRGLDRLVRDADDTVHLHAINARPLDLVSDIDGAVSPLASPLGRRLEALAPSLIVVVQAFDASSLPALATFGRLAAALGTALVAGASPSLAGCTSFARTPHAWDWKAPSGAAADAFKSLRASPEAAHLGLALPRFLLRQPYGAGSDPVTGLAFEEIPDSGDSECFLWGNAALLCAQVLITAYVNDGSVDNASSGRVEGLPVHTPRGGGGTEVTPPAEAWLSERDADTLLRCGLIPVLSVRGSDAVLLPSLRSLAELAAALPFRQP
ncbi:MAG: type VI secretion system contractile sheath large subunit [Opitutaceae bacterium]